MAYTVTLTSPETNENRQGVFTISTTATVNDGTSDVLAVNLSARYDPAAPDFAAAKAIIQKKFIEAWDKYLAEGTMAGSTALATAISTLETQATAYCNS